MKKEKLFRLKLKLEEIIEDESALFPIFSNSQICSGINQIKSKLDIFTKQLYEFVDSTLIPNQITKKK